MWQQLGKRRLALQEGLRRATVHVFLLLLTVSPAHGNLVLLYHAHDGLDEHHHGLPAREAPPSLLDWHHAEHSTDVLHHDDHDASVPGGRIVRTGDTELLHQRAQATADQVLRLEPCSTAQHRWQPAPLRPPLSRHTDTRSLRDQGQSVLAQMLRVSRAILI